MLKRTLFFSNPYHLSVKNAQLEITDKKTGEVRTEPIEDLGFVILEHREITITQSVLSELSANNTAVVICNSKHMPVSMLFHLDTNQVQNEKFRAQVSASEPLKKHLWQQTVKAKIRNQAALLDFISPSPRGIKGEVSPSPKGTKGEVSPSPRGTKGEVSPSQGRTKGEVGGGDALRHIANRVKSGDSTNEEALASRRYWSKLFGNNFVRERFGMPPNPSLNYGYSILRAAVARALCGSGLLPTLGIHHHNKYNAYCLADDIMEPYRPFVDRLVWEQKKNNDDYHNLTTERKAEFLNLLSSDVGMGKYTRPLLIALSNTTASLAKCFEGKEKKIIYPELLPLTEGDEGGGPPL